MGHANLSNLSEFFINRLYARGTLSIAECCLALTEAGEKVHASEGDYEDPYMLALGLTDVIHYLTREDPTQHEYSGPRGGGPWIEPVLTVWLHPRRKAPPESRRMLKGCEANPNDADLHAVTADKLEEDGLSRWADHILRLPALRESYVAWVNEEDQEDYEVFDLIPWKFTAGWKHRYREVPRLSDVTN